MSTTQLQQQVASYRQASYLYVVVRRPATKQKTTGRFWTFAAWFTTRDTKGPFSLLVSSFLEKAGELLLITIGS